MASLVFRVVGLFSSPRETSGKSVNKPTTRNARDVNDFVHAKRLARKKPLATRVQVRRLVSLTLCISSFQTEEAIRYLEICIEKLGNRDQAIHNYLLSLYIEQEDDQSLLRYLQMQGQVSIEEIGEAGWPKCNG